MISKKTHTLALVDSRIVSKIQTVSNILFVYLFLGLGVGAEENSNNQTKELNDSSLTMTATADERLEAIKRALVDLSISSEVELDSVAYLDDKGVLHESTRLSSNADIRGIRVLSYVKAASGITDAEIDATYLSDKTCPGNRDGIIREAVVQVGKNYKNHRVGNHYLNEINELLENTVVDNLSSVEGWAVSGFSVEEPYYMRLVSGRPGNHAAYKIEITSRLLPQITKNTNILVKGPGLVRNFIGLSSNSARLPAGQIEVQITLKHQDSVAPLWQNSYTLKYPEEKASYIKSSLPGRFQNELAAAAESLIKEMQEVFNCRVEYYRIKRSSAGGAGIVLKAGLFNGVKMGDQFLISDTPNLLNQPLSKNGLTGLALAEVTDVFERTSSLKQVAGPKLRNLSRYIALPF